MRITFLAATVFKRLSAGTGVSADHAAGDTKRLHATAAKKNAMPAPRR
jgi:hypothetical protein